VTGRVSRFVHFNGERAVRAAVNKSASRFRDFSIESRGSDLLLIDDTS